MNELYADTAVVERNGLLSEQAPLKHDQANEYEAGFRTASVNTSSQATELVQDLGRFHQDVSVQDVGYQGLYDDGHAEPDGEPFDQEDGREEIMGDVRHQEEHQSGAKDAS